MGKKISQIVSSENGGAHWGWMIFCPACQCGHAFYTNRPGAPKWKFSGSYQKPTFSPSMLVKWTEMPTDAEVEILMKGGKVQRKDVICHSYVTDGKIQFLSDCTHKLRGQTVELPDWDTAYGTHT